VAPFSKPEREFLDRMRVARLATADRAGRPHVIPIVFAVDDRFLFTPIDAKPKRVSANQLKRVRNIRENPDVAVVVDEYHEDWSRLLWVLIRGRAELVEGGSLQTTGIQLLKAKYRQYETMPLANRFLIVVTVENVTTWSTNSKFPIPNS
jgi:PPOX class probable F420-dependent enzyme